MSESRIAKVSEVAKTEVFCVPGMQNVPSNLLFRIKRAIPGRIGGRTMEARRVDGHGMFMAIGNGGMELHLAHDMEVVIVEIE